MNHRTYALALLLATSLTCSLSAWSAETTITVDATAPALPVTRTMTGACLEDVNHEVYGGIDSQLLYGESFQEPMLTPPFADAQVFGGMWQLQDGVLQAHDTGSGPRFISTSPAITNGRSGVEVRFPTTGTGLASLLINISSAGGPGADNFDGYEISLSAAGRLVIGRHQHNWRLIDDVACSVPVGTWIPLEARITATGFEVLVAGVSRFTHHDDHPLAAGTVGLRLWDRDAEFRAWWRDAGSGREELSLRYRDQGRDWRQSGVSGLWGGISSGSASGSFALTTNAPFAGTHSQRLTFTAGSGAVGIENRGLHRVGLFLRAGSDYDGFVCVRADAPMPTMSVALQRADGATVAEATLSTATPTTYDDSGWHRYDFTLTPTVDVSDGRFAILLQQPATVDIGYAFLQPGAWGRFHGLPVRKDVVDALIAQGITVLRYGGSLVNHPAYRWHTMIGPRERRPPTAGTWYKYSSNGWGIIDFLNLCEAMQIIGIPAINCNEDPQDVVDLIAYCTDPTDSTWGKRRAADGHPAPYHLTHLEIGNEEHVDDAYAKKFTAIANAMWAHAAGPTLVVGDFQYNQLVRDPFAISGSAGAPTLAAHQQLLALAKAHDQELWFDMHIGSDSPRDVTSIAALPSVIAALTGLANGARFKVAVFELNGNTHNIGRAVQNALAINHFMRLGGQVPVVCAANCLQVDGANDNGWDQGLLFMNREKTWNQPPYYVTQLFARAWLPLTIPATVSDGRLDVTALTNSDHHAVHLQVVNTSEDAITATIALVHARMTSPTAQVSTLTGPLAAVNTADTPDTLKPVETTVQRQSDGGFSQVFAPYSVTVIRCE